MSHRHHQVDVTYTLTTYFLFGYFHPTTIAHDPLVADALILSTSTFVVLNRPENTLTE